MALLALLAPAAQSADAPTPAATTAVPVPATPSSIDNSVVKIFSTLRYPDLFHPWTKQSSREATGSGVIIPGHRILTNAHVVLYASQVQVQANQSGDKISATVEAIAPGIDLAVLKIDDDSFFDNRPPLPWADALPAIKDTVLVYGFPTGGTNLSITKGIVSRIEFAPYNFPVSGLRIQIDAAINPGNSGGPAVSGDKMIGLAFSRLGGADNIGYIIPCEEIALFLKDVADGHYDGKPAMYDEIQTMENPALRPYLKLGKDVDGNIVRRPDSSDPNYPLKTWDVITKIGDYTVDDEGMVRVGDLRVRFDYLIQKLTQDGKVPLTVVREGKPLNIQLPVSTTRPMLIQSLNGGYPSYFIYGPLVFSTATAEFADRITGSSSGSEMLGMMGSPLLTRRGDRPATPGEELVVISSPFFSSKLAQNYSDPVSWVVKSVNGTKITNLKQLVEVLRDLKDDYVVFDFYGRDIETLVFPRKDVLAATEDILNDNGVRTQGTPELMTIWTAKPKP
jgi:S1-C subfamily serine protease